MNTVTYLRSAIACALLLATAPANATIDREWDFSVYLGEKPIGYHRFRLYDRGLESELESEARFDVKILFFSAYRYEHDARERWRDQCLWEVTSRTDDNGESYGVRGERDGNTFVVQREAERALLPECVMTFAYWNPEFLRQDRLQNPQTGEYLDVTVEPAGRDSVMVRGERADALRYVLRTKDIEITLWYFQDGNWLALDSATADGPLLRYRIE